MASYSDQLDRCDAFWDQFVTQKAQEVYGRVSEACIEQTLTTPATLCPRCRGAGSAG